MGAEPLLAIEGLQRSSLLEKRHVGDEIQPMRRSSRHGLQGCRRRRGLLLVWLKTLSGLASCVGSGRDLTLREHLCEEFVGAWGT